MDILAHTLWAGAGVQLLGRKRHISPKAKAVTMALSALPDIFQMLPVLYWGVLGAGSFEAVRAFAIAIPGHESVLPPPVLLVSHTLHCMAHSAIVAGLVTLMIWWLRPAWLILLLGWWSHILIDVFTHSAEYYVSPVLYPFTERGFDGIAWINPWFMVANYLALGVIGIFLFRSRGVQ